MPGGMVLKLRNFLYMHVGPFTWLQNVILCTKSMQIDFFFDIVSI